MPITLTPLRYPGGKSKYTDLFVDIIADNDLHDCTFVEVFAGGAGSAISLLLKGQVKSLILNDKDISIYSFWKSVKDYPEELIKLIRSTCISIAEWKKQKAIYDSKGANDILTLGFATFYLNRCNHSGILGARPIGGMKRSGNYKINSRYNKATSIAKIENISKYANSIELFNLDGLQFLKLLKQEYSHRKCLIYFDPPYYNKGQTLYLNHLEYEDHKELRNSITGCSFPWVLSYDTHHDIIDLYHNNDCKIYVNNIRHTITGNTKADELIISKLNFPGYLQSSHAINNRSNI